MRKHVYAVKIAESVLWLCTIMSVEDLLRKHFPSLDDEIFHYVSGKNHVNYYRIKDQSSLVSLQEY